MAERLSPDALFFRRVCRRTVRRVQHRPVVRQAKRHAMPRAAYEVPVSQAEMEV